MNAKKSTKARVNLGSSLVYRQQSPSGGYCKAWYLKISMRGQSPWIKATEHLLCSACLDFPRDQKLSAVRGNCACKKPALERAATVLAAETAAVLERRKSPREEAVERRGALTWGEVEPVWLANGPVASRKAIWGKARLMVEQLSGKAMGPQALADWTWSDCLNWAHLRQVYAARFGDEEVGAGSDELPEALRKRVSRDAKRKLEVGRWTALRADLKAGKLGSPLVTSQVLKVNTTIKSYFGAMRNIIGSYSRQVHLRTLSLPPMTDVLEGEISLPSPKGHAEIPEAAYARMYGAVSMLKSEDEQMWLVGQMLWRFGLRPIEVWMARSDWLEETNGVHVLVIKNRQDGYVYESGARKGLTAELKARHRSIERRYRVPADVLEVMRRLMIPGGSPLGLSYDCGGSKAGGTRAQRLDSPLAAGRRGDSHELPAEAFRWSLHSGSLG